MKKEFTAYQSTNSFRYVRRYVKIESLPELTFVLQHGFRDVQTGETHWKDVPAVDEKTGTPIDLIPIIM